MMDNFTHDGHVSSKALSSLIEETLDEMGRLEIAEHLSFCDDCLELYTRLLSDEKLLAPEEPLKAPVLKRIRRKAARIFFNKFTTVAAAAVLAVALGFSSLYRPSSPLAASPTKNQSSFTENFKAFTGDINQALNGFISRISNWEFPQKEDDKKEEKPASSTAPPANNK